MLIFLRDHIDREGRGSRCRLCKREGEIALGAFARAGPLVVVAAQIGAPLPITSDSDNCNTWSTSARLFLPSLK